MSTTNNGGPAFPHSVKNWNDHLLHEQHGMTLRDYFASQALMGLIANVETANQASATLARDAYHLASAMIAERAALAIAEEV